MEIVTKDLKENLETIPGKHQTDSPQKSSTWNITRNTESIMTFFSHTQLTILRLFITWQLVSTSSTGHYQAIVQEHKSKQKLNTVR